MYEIVRGLCGMYDNRHVQAHVSPYSSFRTESSTLRTRRGWGGILSPPPPGLHRGIPRQFRPSQSVMTSHYMPSHSDSAGAMSEEYIGPGYEIPGPGFDTHCCHWSEDT